MYNVPPTAFKWLLQYNGRAIRIKIDSPDTISTHISYQTNGVKIHSNCCACNTCGHFDCVRRATERGRRGWVGASLKMVSIWSVIKFIESEHIMYMKSLAFKIINTSAI